MTIAGGGAEDHLARAAVARHDASNVELVGILRSDAVPALYAATDAGVVLLRDRPLFEAALPTKLLEVMAAGRPAVVSARGDAADLVERAGAGIAVPPEDAHALAEAFRRLGRDPAARARLGEAGRRYVADHHHREPLVDRWVALLEATIARTPDRAPVPA